MEEPRFSFFTIPTMNTPEYKATTTQIISSLKTFEAFTTNLQEKVDALLKAQETQFVKSYKIHMGKVKEEFTKMEEQLKKKEEIILNYENKGEMARLLKKIAFLEEQERKNINTIQFQAKKLKDLEIDKGIEGTQRKRLEDKVKEMYKNNASMSEKIYDYNRNRTNQSIPTFSTEISPTKSQERLSKMLTQEKSEQIRSLHQKSQLSMNVSESQSKLSKQISMLKKKNRELVVMSSKYFQEINEMEKFFIKTVYEIKKNIMTRKEFQECSLEDFRKQDKLELLIKVLSNDYVVTRLHSIIFGEKKKPSSVQLEGDGIKEKIKMLKAGRGMNLPSIKSNRYP